jgi:muconolactone delta-isomerase
MIPPRTTEKVTTRATQTRDRHVENGLLIFTEAPLKNFANVFLDTQKHYLTMRRDSIPAANDHSHRDEYRHVEGRKRQRNTPSAREKRGADWNRDLQICGETRDSRKTPTRVVGRKSNGKSRIKQTPMKYMLTWSERPQGSPMEYENAQKRILEVFTQWKAPANFKIELFVIRVGDWGGYMMLDCDDPAAVHKFCSMLPAFVFEARPVIPIKDAVRVELEAIAFRDGLKRK